MPIGSDDPVSLRSFFILISLRWVGRDSSAPYEGTRHAILDHIRKQLLIKELRLCGDCAATKLSQNDTRGKDTCVSTTQDQLAIFLARKLLEELESSSTDIDQPLYCRLSSATETPRWPRTIVPTR